MRILVPIVLALLLGIWFWTGDVGSGRLHSIEDAPVSAAAPGNQQEPRLDAVLEPSPRQERADVTTSEPPPEAPTEVVPDPAPAGDEWMDLPTEEAPADSVVLTELGLPLDTPLSPRVTRGGPPDPLEPGSAHLTVQLVDSEDGKPCFSTVVLWRLAAPGNTIWTPGDQDVAEVFVGREGHSFGPIAAGEYRIVCAEERATAPQQAAFLVAGETNVEVRLLRPLSRSAYLVPGPNEEVLNAAIHGRFLPPHSNPVEWRKPDWVQPRSIQPDFPWNYWEAQGAFAFANSADSPWTLLLETQYGHELGVFRGNTRHQTYTQSVELRRDGDPWGRVQLTNTSPGPRILVQYP